MSRIKLLSLIIVAAMSLSACGSRGNDVAAMTDESVAGPTLNDIKVRSAVNENAPKFVEEYIKDGAENPDTVKVIKTEVRDSKEDVNTAYVRMLYTETDASGDVLERACFAKVTYNSIDYVSADETADAKWEELDWPESILEDVELEK